MSRRLQLPGVTLVAATSVAVMATVRAMRLSMAKADFGAALLLCDREAPGLDGSGITWRAIPPLASRGDYSRFMLGQLWAHVDTGHALVVQWDGHVVDGGRWQHEFLAHDYIGAPWPWHRDGRAVGNGGFSLRSRRLLLATRALPPGDAAEDVMIGRIHRTRLEADHGIRFADPALAASFSCERAPWTGDSFGFHGVFNMLRFMTAAELVTLLDSLEPGIMGERESGELLTQAMQARAPALLAAAWRHHRRHPAATRRLVRAVARLLAPARTGQLAGWAA